MSAAPGAPDCAGSGMCRPSRNRRRARRPASTRKSIESRSAGSAGKARQFAQAAWPRARAPLDRFACVNPVNHPSPSEGSPFSVSAAPASSPTCAPSAHDDDAMADVNQLLGVGGGHEDRVAALAQASDQMRLISLARADVDAARRIDQNQYLRTGCEPTADLNLLLVAARKRAHFRVYRRALICNVSINLIGDRRCCGDIETPDAERPWRSSPSSCCRVSIGPGSGSRADPAPSARGRARSPVVDRRSKPDGSPRISHRFETPRHAP